MAKTSKKDANNILYGIGADSKEPTIDINNYNHTIASALNYYNNLFTLADYKKSAIEYANTLDINISGNVPEYNFRCIGAVCKLIMRNCTLRVDDIQRTIFKLKEIQSEYDKSKKTFDFKLELVDNTPKIDYLVLDYINDIEDKYIQLTLDNKNPISIDSLLQTFVSNEYNKSQTKTIVDNIDTQLASYNKAYDDKKGSCEQFAEAWKHIPSTRIKNVCKGLELLLVGIKKVVLSNTKAKVITEKVIPPLQLVSKMPYLKEYDGIKGIHPKDAINNSEIWIYDIDTRDIHVIRANKDLKLSASGMTFKNIDESACFKKKLRKIEQLNSFTLALETKTKKTFLTTFNEIKTTQQMTNGRMSENKIIIQAFK